MEDAIQLGELFVCTPKSEQKSALRLGACILLDITQIDGVAFHQKLDCHPNDQEGHNVDREYLKGLHGNSSAISDRTLSQPFRPSPTQPLGVLHQCLAGLDHPLDQCIAGSLISTGDRTILGKVSKRADDHGAGGIAMIIMAKPTMLTPQITVRRTGTPT
jgi:hypothetical protein